MDDPFAQVDKKLGEVVGEFEEPGARARIVKWVVAGVLAIGAMCAVVWMIESHRMPPENARKLPKKPVMIEIVPVKP